MALHQRNDRGEFVNPAGGGPLPKLKVKRGADGRLEVQDPESTPVHEETRPDERPPYPEDPRGPINPDHVSGL
jgi:hypothetical protein